MKANSILKTSMSLISSKIEPYTPPLWAIENIENKPIHRLRLSHLPTPIHELPREAAKNWLPENCRLWMKRDDMTGGIETSGNKIRKLEFLLGDMKMSSLCYDSVVTIGGEQSNHVRATAAACRMVFGKDVDVHTILRMDSGRLSKGEEIGNEGNLLLDQLFGCQIYTCTPGEYGRVGSEFLLEQVCNNLRDKGKIPYCVPLGGSSALGTWGYIEAANELFNQLESLSEPVDHIVFPTGSGGTATGIVLGLSLAQKYYKKDHFPQLHAVGVCDTPDYFYNKMAEIAVDMGFQENNDNDHDISQYFRDRVKIHQGRGLGYAKNTQEELSFFQKFASETGIILDPVYTGKSLYSFLNGFVAENRELFENSNVLFWHTGGAVGMFPKAKNLNSHVTRLHIYGDGPIIQD